MINRDQWEINYSKDFTHKKPISCVTWLTDSVLATAGLEKEIKIFDFKKRTLLHFIKAANELTSITYCQKVINDF